MDEQTFFPGTRVMVFDPRLFLDDRKTPSSHTIRPATVVRWYGQRGTHRREWLYPSLIDVIFDYRPGVESRAHFTSHVEVIK